MSGIVYYILDTETTGLDKEKHEIVEISIIRCSDLNQLTLMIRAEHPETASARALEVTGKTYSDLNKGESKEHAVSSVDTWFTQDGLTPEHRCIVAHNAPFDQRFVHALWKKVNKKFQANCWLDTKTLAKLWANKQGISKPESLTLEASLKIGGIKPISKDVHTAKGDSRNTYLLWKKAIEAGVDHLPCIKRVPHEIEGSGTSIADLSADDYEF